MFKNQNETKKQLSESEKNDKAFRFVSYAVGAMFILSGVAAVGSLFKK